MSAGFQGGRHEAGAWLSCILGKSLPDGVI
jgi:hypothetical protein